MTASYYPGWDLIYTQGELVATHRKVHLFDIDIPGKIKFKVAYLPQLLYDGTLSLLRKARR
jgi:hypothetical protein